MNKLNLTNFNSIKVQLELRKSFTTFPIQTNFNSIKVQLELATCKGHLKALLISIP